METTEIRTYHFLAFENDVLLTKDQYLHMIACCLQDGEQFQIINLDGRAEILVPRLV